MFFGEHVCGLECDGPKGCLAARKEKGRVKRVNAAKELCNQCDVKNECLEAALERDEKFGIWGGLTERERKRLRRSRRQNAT